MFCIAAHRTKMVFESQSKADNFIKFNAEAIAESSKFVPVRSYYCPACAGWHVTHKEENNFFKTLDHKEEIVYLLSKNVSNLTLNFRTDNWKQWLPVMDDIQKGIDEIKDDPRHLPLIQHALRKLTHYRNEVVGCEKKALKRQNREMNLKMTRFRQSFDSIIAGIENLDIEACINGSRKLTALMKTPEATNLGYKNRITYTRSVDCFINPIICSKISRMMETIKTLKGVADTLPLEYLQEEVVLLTALVEDLNNCKIQENIFNMIYAEVRALVKQLRKRENHITIKNKGNKVESETFMDDYQYCEEHLLFIRKALKQGDKDTARALIRCMDERMKCIPLDKEKFKLMLQFVKLSECCYE